jgi:Putative peptidoglycan binding domain
VDEHRQASSRPGYPRFVAALLVAVSVALIGGGLGMWFPYRGTESAANSDLGLALLGSGLAVAAGALVSYGVLVAERTLRHLGTEVADIKGMLEMATEKVADEERGLTPDELAKRNAWWDEFQAYMDSLSPDEKFAVQRHNSILYLSEFGASIAAIKAHLRDLGFYCGSVDDDFSRDLPPALEEFQRRTNMRHVDGMIGQLTLRQIEAEVRRQRNRSAGD